MHQVVISHAPRERHLAEFITNELTLLGIDVVTTQCGLAGLSSEESSTKAIAGSAFFIPLLTREYLKNPRCCRELDLGLLSEEKGGLVVPAFVETCKKLPVLIANRNFADFRGNAERGIDALVIVVLSLSAAGTQTILPGYPVRPLTPAAAAAARRQLRERARLRNAESVSEPKDIVQRISHVGRSIDAIHGLHGPLERLIISMAVLIFLVITIIMLAAKHYE